MSERYSQLAHCMNLYLQNIFAQRFWSRLSLYLLLKRILSSHRTTLIIMILIICITTGSFILGTPRYMTNMDFELVVDVLQFCFLRRGLRNDMNYIDVNGNNNNNGKTIQRGSEGSMEASKKKREDLRCHLLNAKEGGKHERREANKNVNE